MPPRHLPIKTDDSWKALNRFTGARIALGRAGMSLTTQTHLEFQLAHARAKDSVTIPLDFSGLERQLVEDGFQTIQLSSRAVDRSTFLQRPDQGRLLDSASVEKLERLAVENPAPDIVVVIADGLSSTAIERHARPFLRMAVPELRGQGVTVAPIVLVKQGRVAVGDHVGEILSAQMSILLIGERPGLSSPDSMGIYFTFHPRRGVTDAGRNCISNIHGNGLSTENAVAKLLFLAGKAQELQLSGVPLKEDASLENGRRHQKYGRNFLLEAE